MAVSSEAKVGLVFFLGLCVLAIVTIMVGHGELRIHRRGYTIDVLFDSVGGLRKNDPVELGGMKVGKVESLKVQENKVKVRIRLNGEVIIRKDSKITVQEKSLLGGKVVSITMGTSEERVLPGETLKGELIPGTTELIGTISGIGKKFDETLGELEESVPELTSAFESINRITKKIEEGKSALGKLATEEETGEKLDKIITELEKAVPKLNSLLESANRISEKIEREEGLLGKLVGDEEFYEEVAGTLQATKDAGAKVREFTDRIEKVKTFIGLDSAYNEKNSHTLTKVYLRIEPRPHKLYLVGASALTGPGTEWDEKDEADLELDLQIGRRFFDNKLTGIIGLFETRIGAGAEYAFNDRFSILLEGRNAWSKEKDEDIEPFLLRGRFQWRIWRGFYVHAGSDNILDEPAANLGIKLEYSDEDIKYMLSTIGLGT